MLRSIRVLALLGVLLAFVAWVRGERFSPPPIPCSDCNVLLVSIDTLRADHLSLYGYARPTSPHLDRLAREAVVFEQAFNHGGFTLPEHVSLLTSVPPAVHRVQSITRKIEPERVTLAEQLRDAGHRTAAFTDGAWMAAQFGFEQGFESYDDAGGGLRKTLPKVLSWIAAHRREPWFVFLHTYDVHTTYSSGQPYECPGEWGSRFLPRTGARERVCADGRCNVPALLWLQKQRQSDPTFSIRDHVTPYQVEVLKAEYDGCIRWVDTRLRDLLDRLKEWGLYERTLVVVTSDHGEKFLEHDELLHEGAPFDELVRVPLLMKLPGERHGGRRVDALVSSIDTMPTVLSVVGVTPNDDVQGHDLLPLLADGKPRRPLVSVGAGVRTPDWKLIKGWGRNRLYDLRTDPAEQHDVAPQHPRQVRGLAQAEERIRRRAVRQRKAFLRRLGDAARVRRPEPSKQEIDRLQALGYLE
jgi:arylsulfatase